MQSQHKFLFALTLRIGADENSRFSSLGNYVGFSRAALFLVVSVRPSDCARIAEAAESSAVPVRPPARVRVLPSIVGREGTTRKSDSVVRSSFLWCDLPIVRPRPSVRPFSGATNRRAGDSPPRTPLPRRTPARRRPHFIRVARAREGCGRGTLRDPWLWSPIFSSMSLLQNRQLLHFFCPPMRNKVALEIRNAPSSNLPLFARCSVPSFASVLNSSSSHVVALGKIKTFHTFCSACTREKAGGRKTSPLQSGRRSLAPS